MEENIIYKDRGTIFYFFAITEKNVYGFMQRPYDSPAPYHWDRSVWLNVNTEKNLFIAQNTINIETIEKMKKQFLNKLFIGLIK